MAKYQAEITMDVRSVGDKLNIAPNFTLLAFMGPQIKPYFLLAKLLVLPAAKRFLLFPQSKLDTHMTRDPKAPTS